MRHLSQPATALAFLFPALLSATACSANREMPGTVAAVAEPPVVSLTAVDYAFEAPDTVEAGVNTAADRPGRHVIRVENAGTEPHEVAFLRLAPGKTMADFQAWMQNPQGPPPGNSVGGVSSLAPRLQAYFEVDLTAADYVILCFVTAPDGRSHTEHGMIRHVRID